MVSAADRASVLSGEQDEAIHQLIALGQEKGYLRREEIDAVMPVDVTASAVLNDLLSQCGEVGIDVVRLYLADMSRVPLLTRDKEVALAKRIERGHRTVMVAISHTPSLVQQVMRLGDALREDERLIRRLVTHRHRELTATRLKRRARQVRVQIEAVRTILGRRSDTSRGLAACAYMISAHRPAGPVERAARGRAGGPADASHSVQ